MRVNRLLGLSMILGAGCLCLPACGGGSSCSDNNACGTSGTGGSSGTGGGAGSGGTSGSGGSDGGAGTAGTGGSAGDGGQCDTNASPATESCLVSDTYGVFVDGTVATSGDGSQASPYKTIAEAVTNAGGKIILVCDTTYDEQVKLGAGAKIYGGFKCADWSYESGQRAVVKPGAEGYALEVDTVTDPVVIEDMEFDSADATAAGGSSIAAFVHGSTNVALHRDRLVAGKGVAGKNGVLTKYTYPTQTDLNGNAAVALVEGATKQCTCPAGDTTTGGRGGSGGVPEDGKAGLPNLGGGQAGKAGQPCAGNPSGAGHDGNPATDEAPAAGASTSGTLDASGWTPANGTDGKAGGPGQGGGGGASDANGGGGGGGCGGCGGAGGPGGDGGGASIALMVLNSTVSVDVSSELVTSAAGDGGSGAAGQAGETTTGVRGLPAAGGGCQGGNGGKGGAGADGGGGAGGISVAVLWKGAAAPAIDAAATLTPGTKGAAGTGGKPGTNDGIDGISKGVLQVQ